ncbi:MAG: chemotaxis protein CheB [Flaviaesturariibacter sp.]|nr:chemotaxis protein CheB [Flaviaesturariibacter sp.]
MAQDEVNGCKLLVIGGSAGSLEVLLQVFPHLRKDLAFPIVVIMHRKAAAESTLEDLLNSKTQLKVKEADDKETIRPGVIYIAPADYHVLIEKDGTLSLDASEKINYCRPAIDITFETAADSLGPALTCLLLSGANADGANGLRSAASLGARILIQDPTTSDVSYMPQAGLAAVKSATVLAIKEISGTINSL